MGPRKVGAHFCQNPKIAGKESFAWLKFVGFDKLMRKLNMQPNTLHPSVRCGVEMAVLAALAESLSLSLSNLLMGRSLQKSKNKETTERAKGGVKICALIESDGTPEEVADIAAAYVKQGFCTLKLKVSVDHQAGSSYISQNQPPVISSCFLSACRMATVNIH